MNNYLYPPPFYSYNPYYNQYKNIYNNMHTKTDDNNFKKDETINSTINNEEKNQKNTTKSADNSDNNTDSRFFAFNTTEYINLFGIKLYMDDLLIITLLIFLYLEEVTDILLFISLILILMS